MSAADPKPNEVFVVELTREEAALLRARAAAHGVSVEDETITLVEGAIQRHRATGGRP